MYTQCIENKADIAICGRYFVEENGNIIDITPKIKKVMNKEEVLKELFDEKYVFTTLWDKMFKSDIAKKHTFNVNKKVGEDYDYLYRVILESNIISVDTNDTLYYYVKRNGSVMNSRFNIQEYKEEIKLCENIIEYVKEKYPNIYLYAIKRCTRVMRNTIKKAILEDDKESVKLLQQKGKKYGLKLYSKWPIKEKVKIFIIFKCTFLWKKMYQLKKKIR